MDIWGQVLKLLWDSAYGMAGATVVGVLLIREWKILANPNDKAFKTRIDLLYEQSPRETYLLRLKHLLNSVSRFFGPLSSARPDSWQERHLSSQPWTPEAFGRLLYMAVAYPILFLLLGWLISNQGNLGGLTVLPPTQGDFGWLKRAGILLWLGLVIYLFYRMEKSEGWRSWVWLAVAVAFAVAVAVAVAVAGAGAFAGAFAVAVAVAGAVAGAGAFAFAGAFAVAGAFAFAGAFAGTVAVAFVFGIEKYYKYCSDNKTLAGFWLQLWCALLACIALGLYFVAVLGEPAKLNDAYTLLLFLGILPLFNAPLDWLSFGFTRGLLHAIAEGQHTRRHAVFWAVADLIIAVIFLIAVAFSCVLGITLVNAVAEWAGSVPVINLETLWIQLLDGRWQDNLWIWLMLGSTLIPTILHFLIALYALMTLCFSSEKALKHAKSLEEIRQRCQEIQQNPDNQRSVNDAGIDSDAQMYAFFYLLAKKGAIHLVWLACVLLVSYPLFTYLPDGIRVVLLTLEPAFKSVLGPLPVWVAL